MMLDYRYLGLDSAKVIIETSSKSNNLMLKCQITGAGISIITWYKDNIKIKESPKIEISADELNIRHPSVDDSGSYRCVVYNGRKRVESDSIDVSMANADDHKRSNLCPNWYVNAIPAATLLKVSATNNHNVRRVRSLADNRAIQILCRSKRDGGAKKDTIKIESGNQVTLNCNMKNVDGSGPLKVNWNKDGKYYRHAIIVDSDDMPEQMDDSINNNHSRVSVSAKNGSLIISAAIPLDGGQYECNVIGSDNTQISSRHMRLDVTEALKFAPPPTSKHVELGTMARVHCKVQGTPTPSVRWIKVRIFVTFFIFSTDFFIAPFSFLSFEYRSLIPCYLNPLTISMAHYIFAMYHMRIVAIIHA